MNNIQRTVINLLLNKYEESKTFQGTNQRKQQFAVVIEDRFPRYKDDADYDYFIEMNDSLYELEEKNYIQIEKNENSTIHRVTLNQDSLEQCYQYVSRKSKAETNTWLFGVWQQYELEKTIYEPLNKYIRTQRKKQQENKKIEFYDGSQENYIDVLKAVKAVLENEEEIFVRDFSIAVFRDSKRVSQLESKISSLLYAYGDFEEKDSVMEECGIVKTPTYVMVKGNVVINLHGQVLNLSRIDGDIAMSTVSLKELESIKVLGNRVVTIENLTSFHDYHNRGDCVIYLGGFHNRTKRKFIQFLYSQNQQAQYYHFGDIDAGGFYILEHLKRKTGIAFRSLYMDKETLLSHIKDTKKLTKNDRLRLQRFRDEQLQRKSRGEMAGDYLEVIDCMLEMGCKLEQEAVAAE